MSERSAYAWKRSGLPGDTKKKRSWRTRPDPFDEVWDTELAPVLKADAHSVMKATTLIADLQKRHGRQYGLGQLASTTPLREVHAKSRASHEGAEPRLRRDRTRRPRRGSAC